MFRREEFFFTWENVCRTVFTLFKSIYLKMRPNQRKRDMKEEKTHSRQVWSVCGVVSLTPQQANLGLVLTVLSRALIEQAEA